MDKQLQAIVTILSLVNPMVCGMIFSQLEGGQTRQKKWMDASQAAFAVLVVLVLAALFGTQVLHIFGVSLDAFSVAGGMVLSWIGFSMLSGNTHSTQSSGPKSKSENSSLTPLILFAASPGTITGVITVAAAQRETQLPVTALVAVAAAVAVMWVVLIIISSSKKSADKGGFVRDTMTRFMGLIVVAMGVQFALTGLRAFMN